jgi:hypothetical protein
MLAIRQVVDGLAWFASRQRSFLHQVLLQPDRGANGNVGAIIAGVAADRLARRRKAGPQRHRQAVLQSLSARQAQFPAMHDQEPADIHKADIDLGRHQDGARAVQQVGEILLVPVQVLGHAADQTQDPHLGIAAC